MICPHCRRGELRELPKDYYYSGPNKTKVTHICDVCGRGWGQDEKKRWHSHFATDVEVYSENGHTLIDSSTWHLNEGKK
jgi:hypothetical protein